MPLKEIISLRGAQNTGFSGVSAVKSRAFKALGVAPTFAGVLLLTACASHGPPKPPPVPTVVSVPIPVSCIPKSLPEKPVYPFTLAQILEADGPERYRRLGANYVVMMQRLSELEPLATACR